MRCPSCNFDNPENQKFCGNCGSPLTIEIAGEKKNVTVLFTDISKFSTISEHLDPENVQELLNTVFDLITKISEKYGGTIDKFIGDEVLILFGTPISTENHVERAIMCALDINRKIEQMAGTLPAEIKMHMGIHTGKVVIGEVGGEKVKDFTVIGDTVNLASRLRVLAPPGEIYTSDETVRKAKAFADFEFIQETSVRGRSSSVKVYKVLNIKEKREAQRGIENLYSPMIGRSKELKMLIDTYISTVKNSKLSVVLIEGDAGIGKSRLYNEFLEWVDATKVYQSKFLPFAQEPDFPLKDILKQYFNLNGDEKDDELFKAIDSKLVHIKGLPKDAPIIIAKFLSIIPYESDEDPKTLRQTLLYIVNEIIRQEKDNIIIGIEDIHWADTTSLETFNYLVKFIRNCPVMFIFMTRPLSDVPGLAEWKEILIKQEFTTLIELSSLQTEDADMLISNLLSVEKLPQDIKNEILEKGDGNPLFIEEIIKTMIDREYIYFENGNYLAKPDIEEFEVPETVEDIFFSRVDNLPAMTKKVIQAASIIGDVFWDKPLDYLLTANTKKSLDFLLSKDFIEKRSHSSFEGLTEFKFKHTLLAEAIYKSILKRQRKTFHRNYAGWLLENYSDKERQLLTFLAYHFEMGEEYEKAVKYYILVGDTFASQYAPQNAVESYKKALFYIKNTGVFEDLLWDVLDKLGRQYSLLGRIKEAEQTFSSAISYAEKKEDLARAIFHYGYFLESISRYNEAIFILQEALDACEDNNILKLQIYHGVVWIYHLKGEIDVAYKYLEQLKESAKKFESIISMEEYEKNWANIYKISAILKSDIDDTEGSIDDYNKALRLYKKYNDIFNVGKVYNNLANQYKDIGEFSRSINLYKKAIEIERMVGSHLDMGKTYYNLGRTYSLINNLDMAEELYNKSQKINELIENKQGEGFCYHGLAGIYANRGEYEKSIAYAEKSIEIFKGVGSKYLENMSLVQKVSVLIKMARFDNIDELLKQAFEYAGRQNNKYLFGELYMIKGQEMLAIDELNRSEEYLNKAEGIFEMFRSIQSHKDLYIQKIRLYEKIGDDDSANIYKEKLRLWVNKILDGIKEDELKDKFLKSPDLQIYIN
jgi:class 3 adenylate cyclase/tetratricopeptide (TPR) repeat protein